MRIESVDPISFSEEASSILDEAWPPPSLHYTPDYLRWQFRFPASSASLGVAAFDGEKPVAFIGATPRLLHHAGVNSEAFLLSFLAVRPDWQGKGLATLLYDTVLEEVAQKNLPVISFAQPDSTGEHCLKKAYPRSGFTLRKIASLPTYSYLERASLPDPPVHVEEINSPAEFNQNLQTLAGDEYLHVALAENQLTHYGRDPRRRISLLLRGSDGRCTGGAMIVLAQVKSERGIEDLPMVDNLFLPEPGIDAVAAVCRYAGRRWSSGDRLHVVNLLNPGNIDSAISRSAGLRKTSPGFNAYLASVDGGHPYLNAQGTTLEVV